MHNVALVVACLAYMGGHGQRVRTSTSELQHSMCDAEIQTLLHGRVRRRGALNPLKSLAKLFLALAPPAAFSSIVRAGSRPAALEKHVRLGQRHHRVRVLNRHGHPVPEMTASDKGVLKVKPEQESAEGLFCTACTKAAAMFSAHQSSEMESLAGTIMIPPYVQLCPGSEDEWLVENKLTALGSLFRYVVSEDEEEPLPPEAEDVQVMNPREFTVRTFNVLAGNFKNSNPWMLQGAEVTKEQRDAIWKKFENGDRSWRRELSDEQWQRIKMWDERVFNWNLRKELLLEEMFAGDPDVVTLQELDHYEGFFRHEFDQRRYGCVYAQRLGKQDGVAVIFNRKRYRLLARSGKFYLPDEADNTPVHQPGSQYTVSAEVKNAILRRAQNLRNLGGYGRWGSRVAVFVLLQDRTNPQRKVMVGTTHLDKSPDDHGKSLSRINQMSVLNVIQDYLAKKWGVQLESDIAVLAGDFNTDMREVTMVKQPALAGEDHRLTNMSIQPSLNSCTSLTEDRKLWIDYVFHAGQAEVTGAFRPPSSQDPMPNLNHASDHFPLTAKFRWTKGWASGPVQEFIVPEAYDYECSTEDNYAAVLNDKNLLVGEFMELRKILDYTYHRVYQAERQEFQDRIVNHFLHAVVLDSRLDASCEAPETNWIVFTAGGMGAGKSYTMEWLHSHNYFPLEAFVYADPDRIRCMFPEMDEYVTRDGPKAGIFTQKEAGYVSQILTEAALQQGKNVIVDGSLRDHEWYLEYFKELRSRYPLLKIGIIHVNASLATEYGRAAERAQVTGRVIPDDVMRITAEQIPKSLEVLTPHSDFFATVDTEGPEPKLVRPREMTWEEFRETWVMQCPITSE